jgi:hypothetical protein
MYRWCREGLQQALLDWQDVFGWDLWGRHHEGRRNDGQYLRRVGEDLFFGDLRAVHQ